MSRLPKLLLSLALLFWGATIERWDVAVPCALLIPAADWTRLRWDFGEKAWLAAWRISVLFLTIAMVLVVMQGPRLTLMSRVFTWLPVVLLPMQFVQSYGTSDTLSLGTFSMMMRRRQQHAVKYGLPFREIRFGFDNVYFCATLLAACLAKGADSLWFYPAMLILVSWALIARSGKAWPGIGFAMVFVTAAVFGIAGQRGLTELYTNLGSRGAVPSSPSERNMGIGDLGEIKQSPEIFWRIIPENKSAVPRLLRVASYNRFGSPATWEAVLPRDTGNETNDFLGMDFTRDPSKPPDDPDAGYHVCPPGMTFEEQYTAIRPELASFRLRGAMDASAAFVLMPLPENAASLQFDTAPQRNSFGTVRVDDPPSVCDVRVLWDPKFTVERPPWESVGNNTPGTKTPPAQQIFMPDLDIPRVEQEVIRDIAEELELHEGTVEEKIEVVRQYFAQNFRYTRYNSVPKFLHTWTSDDKSVARYARDVRSRGRRATLLSVFLEHTKAGHCEFFATASALLLREAGVPTRYTSGFVIAERDPKSGEYLVRGTHAHAWCRAWDEENQRWWDVDVTPSSWLSVEKPRTSAFQGLQDWLQIVKEDLVVWRDQPGRMMMITLVMLTPVVIGLAVVGRKLWRSRKRVEMNGKRGRRAGALQTTPLASLEKAARRLLGERPTGTPVGPYLMPLAARLPNPELLGEALKLHHRLRFDPQEKSPDLIAELQFLVAEIRRQLGAKGSRASAKA